MRRVTNNLQSGRFSRIALLTVVFTATLGTLGCRYNRCGLGYNQCFERCFAEMRAKHRAAAAWDCCPNRCASEHVRAGFIDGYVNVALGGDGCTPAVAPSKYWGGWHYSGIAGQQAGAQWLQGFPLGALAAEGDGAAYQVAALAMEPQNNRNAVPSAYEQTLPQVGANPGPDTIDNTIEFLPGQYLDNPSDVSPDAAKDNGSVEDPSSTEDAAQRTDGLNVKTIAAAKEKSVKTLITPPERAPGVEVKLDSAPPTEAAKKTVTHLVKPKSVPVVEVKKDAVPAVEKLKTVADDVQLKSLKPVEVKSKGAPGVEAAKTVVDDIPELSLEPNDEVFGFGIE